MVRFGFISYVYLCAAATLVQSSPITLENCENKNSINNILLISFQSSCDKDCAVSVMERSGVAADSYDHMEGVNIITLNEHTEDQLPILRNDNENVDSIGCDGIVSISSPITLENCENQNSIGEGGD